MIVPPARQPSKSPGPPRATVAVFVHGLFSSPKTWGPLLSALREKGDLASLVEFRTFPYDSPRARWSLKRRVPSLEALADQLHTFLHSEGAIRDAARVALIGHSFGGLVVQAYLERQLSKGAGRSLARVRRVVLIATPNSGSQLLLLVRRAIDWLHVWGHPQERVTRPLDEGIERIRQIVFDRVVYAVGVGETSCHIPVDVFAAASDGVVPRASALGLFPNVRTLPGDHHSIIEPGVSGPQVVDEIAEAILKAHSSVLPEATTLRTEALDYTQEDDLEAVVRLQHERFPTDAHMSLADLKTCFLTYEPRWGFRPQLIVARIDDKPVGFVLFSETKVALVAGLLSVARSPLSGHLTERLIGHLVRRSRELGDRPIVFEVRDPADDPAQAKVHRAKIRLFQKHGARVVEGLSFLAPDMSHFPAPGLEKRYLLMYGKPGASPEELLKSEVASFVDTAYRAFYFCWFSGQSDEATLDRYRSSLVNQVMAVLPERVRLVQFPGS